MSVPNIKLPPVDDSSVRAFSDIDAEMLMGIDADIQRMFYGEEEQPST